MTVSIGDYRDELLDPKTIISDAVLTSLENDYLIGDITKIVAKNNSFYLLDHRHTRALYAYDKKDQAMTKYHSYGSGPNEYIEIRDFDTGNETLYLLCYPMKLQALNPSSLELEREIPLDEHYDRITVWRNIVLLYRSDNGSIVKLDPETGETTLVFQSEQMFEGYIPTSQRTFYTIEEKLYFHGSGSDVIYSVDEELNFSPFLLLDYSKKDVAHTFYQNRGKGPIRPDELGLYPMPDIVTMFPNNGEVDFMYSMFIFAINTQEKNGQRVNMPYIIPGAASYGMTLSEDGKSLITHISGVDIDKMEEVGFKVPALLKNTDLHNPVIIEYRLNSSK